MPKKITTIAEVNLDQLIEDLLENLNIDQLVEFAINMGNNYTSEEQYYTKLHKKLSKIINQYDNPH